MRILIGADHRGVRHKAMIKEMLCERGHEVEDVGPDSEQSVDYPDYGLQVARGVAEGRADRGVLICGSGIGMSIVANRVRGVRATLCLNEQMARMARTHNNSNVLCLSQDLVDEDTTRRIVDLWLTTEFEGGRHSRRLDKIDEACASD